MNKLFKTSVGGYPYALKLAHNNCKISDKELGKITGNPFIFYLPNVSVAGNPIGFKGAGSNYEELSNTVKMPSHAIEIDNGFNVNFNAEINEYTRNVLPNTIFNKYYADYITDMFSIRRRIYNYDAILPVNLMNNLI